jgi:hypothetical protein
MITSAFELPGHAISRNLGMVRGIIAAVVASTSAHA